MSSQPASIEGGAFRVLRMQITIPPFPGGMEKHVRRLSDEQRRQGCNVHLLFSEGAPLHHDDQRIGEGLIAAIRPQALRSLVFFMAVLPELMRLRGRIDLVHTHGDWSMAVLGRMAKLLVAAPVSMVSVHGGPMRSRIRKFLQRFLGVADIVHATGRRDAERLSAQLRREVFWQASGIDDLFLSGSDDPAPRPLIQDKYLAVTVGVLRPKKNIDLVLDIAKSTDDWIFVVIGDGPQREHLQRRVRDESLGNVRFVGALSAEEICRWHDVAHAFLCTSDVEGTPTSMLEAMARGVPVVTSDCGDFRGIIEPGVTGWIVGDYMARSFVERLTALEDDARQWQAMSSACRAYVGTRTWGRVATSITERMRLELMARSAGDSKRPQQ
jgi:glycosyltransferase involved in cell wall biosynthesis